MMSALVIEPPSFGAMSSFCPQRPKKANVFSSESNPASGLEPLHQTGDHFLVQHVHLVVGKRPIRRAINHSESDALLSRRELPAPENVEHVHRLHAALGEARSRKGNH